MQVQICSNKKEKKNWKISKTVLWITKKSKHFNKIVMKTVKIQFSIKISLIAYGVVMGDPPNLTGGGNGNGDGGGSFTS